MTAFKVLKVLYGRGPISITQYSSQQQNEHIFLLRQVIKRDEIVQQLKRSSPPT